MEKVERRPYWAGPTPAHPPFTGRPVGWGFRGQLGATYWPGCCNRKAEAPRDPQDTVPVKEAQMSPPRSPG